MRRSPLAWRPPPAPAATLSAAARHQLAREWNDSAAAYPAERSLADLWAEQVRRTPELPAVADGGGEITYRELDRRAVLLADRLRRLGVQPEVRVGLQAEHLLPLVVATLAVVRAGGAYVPLDPAYPRRRLAMMAEDAGIAVLVAEDGVAGPALDECARVAIGRDGACAAGPAGPSPPDEGAPRRQSRRAAAAAAVAAWPESLAYVIYTSGSTGQPKGVAVPHRAVVRLVRGGDYARLGPGDRVAQVANTAFDAATFEIWGALLNGACLVAVGAGVALAPRRLAAALRELRVTTLFLTTPLFHQLVDEAPGVFAGLRYLLFGGEAVDAGKVRRLLAAGPPARLLHVYGPTENTTFSTWERVSAVADGAATVPIGRPLANSTAYLIDGAGGLAPAAAAGELAVGGDGIARGYQGRPDLTAERFLPDPWSGRAGARLYRTGDRARRRPDGRLEFLGRIDRQVKLRGFRVEPAEIEAALARQPGVREAVAVVREDRPGDRRLVAYVTVSGECPDGGGEPDDLAASARVDEWRAIFDRHVYHGERLLDGDPRRNVTGWTSSLSGQPLGAGAMREWLSGRVERILAREPRRVLEIGCGTGALAFALAPSCVSYLATDVAAAGLDYMRARLAEQPQPQLAVALQAAGDFSRIAPASFDAVILNSVVQYFPDLDYLLRVLEGAAAALAPGGFLFLGDVRSLPLLPALHAWRLDGRPRPKASAQELREWLHRGIAEERELTLDPALWAALAQRIPRLNNVEIQLERGGEHNELTCFRYDVWLELDGERAAAPAATTPPATSPAVAPPGPSPDIGRDWRRDRLDLEALARLLREGRESLLLTGIPNARLVEPLRLLGWQCGTAEGFAMGELAPVATLALPALAALTGDGEPVEAGRETRQATAAGSAVGAPAALGAVDPEALWRLGEELGYRVAVGPSATGGVGDCDAVFTIGRTGARPGLLLPVARAAADPDRPWSSYANQPSRPPRYRLGERLRRALGDRLPSYMMPAAVVVLDRLPLTPSGKLDRQALPPPRRGGEEEVSAAASGTPLEELICGLWAELLGVSRVGVDEDLVALGAHSLLAARVLARLHQLSGVEVSLAELFTAGTVAALAARVEVALAGGGGLRPPAAIPVRHPEAGPERELGRRPAGELARRPEGELARRPEAELARAPAPAQDRAGAGRGGMPLSFAQERLWLIDQIQGGAAYHLPLRIELSGRLNAGALRQALSAVEGRHEILRTTFAADLGTPYQVVASPRLPALPWIDLAGLPAAARQGELWRVAAAQGSRPFDLGSGPLWRVLLLALAAGRHAVAATLHHIVADGWSLEVLLRELAELYAAFAAGGGPAPAPLPIQYADYAAWQRAWLGGAVLDEELAYWRCRLAGLAAAALPADRPALERGEARGATLEAALAPGLCSGLAALCREAGATLFMGLAAGFAALLSRITGGQDVVFGTPVAQRDRVELEGLIGFLVNTLALRLDLQGRPGFAELLARVRSAVLADFAHRHLPFERLVAELRPERRLHHNPLFEVAFSHNRQLPPRHAGGVVFELSRQPSPDAKFDLHLEVVGEGSELVGFWEYSTARFDRATVRRLAGQLAALLGEAAAAPEQRLSELALLSVAERHQLVVEWNEAGAWAGSAATLAERFALQAAARPDAVAVAAAEGWLSYGELDRRAAALGGRLRQLGVGAAVAAESVVGVCMERGAALVVALLGIIKAGGAYLPLDPSHPAERLRWMLADAGAGVVLARRQDAGWLEEGRPERLAVVWLDAQPEAGEGLAAGDAGDAGVADAAGAAGVAADEALGGAAGEAGAPGSGAAVSAASRAASGRTGSALPGGAGAAFGRTGSPLPAAVGAGGRLRGRWPESLAYVIYTSGSTGHPKGVAVPEGAVVRLVAGGNYVRLGPAEVVAQAANASFDAATFEIWGALLNGARLVVVPREVTLSPELLVRRLRQEGATVLFLTTALVHWLASAAPGGLGSLRQLLFGGEAVDPSRIAELLAGGGPERLVHVYGPTENTTFSSYAVVGEVPAGATTLAIGLPISGTELHLLDGEQAPVPIGATGEIHAGGAGLARGYLGRPELTASRFVPSPLAGASGAGPGARLYRTGDLGRRRADGGIEFLGRVDGQVKIRGFRIEPAEVEAALGTHPGVAECAVLARRPGGAGELALVAYVVPRRGAAGGLGGLREHLRRKLPDYMVPARFVELDGLPRTANGKLDRGALLEPREPREPSDPRKPAEPAERAGGRQGGAAPRTPIEELLAGLWAELLGGEPVGRDDDFFALGGHSLLATRLLARVRRLFGVELRPSSLFAGPTVAALAAEIAGGQAGGAPPLPPLASPPARHQGSAEPAFHPVALAQRRLWFLQQLAGAATFLNVPCALDLAGPLAASRLAAALARVVARHAPLRTRFAVAAGEPVQHVAAAAPLPLPIVDLAALAAERRQAEALRLAVGEAERQFDLGRPPLARAVLLRRGAADHRLVFVAHHLIFDGWSIGVLFRELEALYGAPPAGAAPGRGRAGLAERADLPELPISYTDFAAWQSRVLAGGFLSGQLAYWRQQLAGLPALELPCDRPRGAAPGFRGGFRDAWIAAPGAAALGALCRRQGVTLFMALLAACEMLLGRLTGQLDFGVGAPVAGRGRPEVEGLIGFFVNTLVLRADLSGEPSFAALLVRTRAVALAAYTHQELPFATLVEALNPARQAAQNPLFAVALSLEETPTPPRLAGLDVERVALEGRAAHFDLTLIARPAGGGLELSLNYRRDLFDAATAMRLLRAFTALLQAAAAQPEAPAWELPALDAAARQQLLREQGVAAAVPLLAARLAAATVDRCVERQVERCPDALALQAGSLSVTYGELDRRANRLAHQLRQAGVRNETRVAVCLERSPELAIAALAALKAGGAYLPCDPETPAERLAELLADAGVRVALTARRHRPAFAAAGAGVELLAAGDLGEDAAAGAGWFETAGWPETAGLSATAPDRSTEPSQIAYVIYTSGSTGRPKGVEVPHHGLANLVAWHLDRYRITAADRASLVAHPAFDAAVWELWPYLAAGASLHVPPPAVAASPRELLAWMAVQAITVAFLPTPLAEAVLRLPQPASLALRLLLTGGDRLRQRPAPGAGFVLVNHYGPTESSVVATAAEVPALAEEPAKAQSPALARVPGKAHLPVVAEAPGNAQLLALAEVPANAHPPVGAEAQPPAEAQPRAAAEVQPPAGTQPPATADLPAAAAASAPGPLLPAPPIGRPIAGLAVYLLDRLQGLAPPGAAGEVAIGGAGLARGYLGRADWTAERFLPHPWSDEPGARLYRTGDLGRWRADGQLEFLGRADQQVKVRGYRVELGEVEAALARHPGVRAAAVVARRDAGGAVRLDGYFVPPPGLPPPAAAELRQWLRGWLPAHMLPAALQPLAALPLTARGKLDRAALAAIAPPPAAGSAAAVGGAAALPRRGLEAAVGRIWCEVLGLAAVGAEDNFFDLGGHSLALVAVQERLREDLDAELPLLDLFESPTVRALAARLGDRLPRQPGAIRGAGAGGRQGHAGVTGAALAAAPPGMPRELALRAGRQRTAPAWKERSRLARQALGGAESEVKT